MVPEDNTFDDTPLAAPAPSRRTPLSYVSSAARRSVRETLTRQRLVDGIKAFFWVAPLTILIWIYAEREKLSTVKGFTIPVEVRSADSRQVIIIKHPDDGRVTADLLGPKVQLDRVRDEFRGLRDTRAVIDLGQVSEQGPRQISAELVGDDARFASNGVMLSNLQPRNIDIYVDILDDVDVDVAVPPGIGNLSNVVFDPPRVKLTAPRSVLRESTKPLIAYVDPASLQQEAKIPGRRQNIKAQLVNPIRDLNARLDIAVVNASFDVKQADVETTLSSIPVWVTFAPGLEQQYKVDYEPSLPNVVISGPADVISAIENQTALPRPKAIFEVSRDNIAARDAVQHAKVKYDLPDGVQVKPAGAPRTIEFRLIERTPGE